jgi:catechol 2,3-dioxygenase-like lactoylglutathione lyase family enzyme
MSAENGTDATAPNTSTLSITLTVNDLQKSLQFYTEGLGFEVHERHESEGVLRFVMIESGEVHLGLGQDDFAKGRDREKGVGMRLWITTSKDLNSLANRARGAGIVLDREPEALPWGAMAFAVTDPDGFKVTIAQGG